MTAAFVAGQEFKSLRPNGKFMRHGRIDPIPSRVYARIDKRTAVGALRVPRTATACNLWLGGVNDTGRPQIKWYEAPYDYSAPVVQLQMRRHLGGRELDGTQVVCHTCDVGTCVNIDHLYLGSAKTNGSDRRRRGSSRDQGVLALEVAAQLCLRDGKPKPAWLLRNMHLAAEVPF